MPAPSAAPLTAAMTGAGIVDDRVEHPLERGPERVAATVLEPTGVLGAAHDVRARAERRRPRR